MRIAFVIVATNKYIQFAPPLIDSIHKHFLKDTDKDYFVFTNVMDHELPHEAKKVQILPKGWPGDSYYRYHYFLSIREDLEKYDYIYYLDADMKVVGDVGEEVLTDLLGIQHPWFTVNRQSPP